MNWDRYTSTPDGPHVTAAARLYLSPIIDTDSPFPAMSEWTIVGTMPPGETLTFNPTKAAPTMDVYTQGSADRTMHSVRAAMDHNLDQAGLHPRNGSKRARVLDAVLVPVKQVANSLHATREKIGKLEGEQVSARMALMRALPSYSGSRALATMIDDLDRLRRQRVTPAEQSLSLIVRVLNLDEGKDIVQAVKDIRTANQAADRNLEHTINQRDTAEGKLAKLAEEKRVLQARYNMLKDIVSGACDELHCFSGNIVSEIKEKDQFIAALRKEIADLKEQPSDPQVVPRHLHENTVAQRNAAEAKIANAAQETLIMKASRDKLNDIINGACHELGCYSNQIVGEIRAQRELMESQRFTIQQYLEQAKTVAPGMVTAARLDAVIEDRDAAARGRKAAENALKNLQARYDAVHVEVNYASSSIKRAKSLLDEETN